MTHWIWLVVAIAFFGNTSDRTIILFSSQNCPACRKIQPVIDQLNLGQTRSTLTLKNTD